MAQCPDMPKDPGGSFDGGHPARGPEVMLLAERRSPVRGRTVYMRRKRNIVKNYVLIFDR